MYFTPLFGAITHATISNYDKSACAAIGALISGLQVVVVTYCFSNLSGAVNHTGITIALWITNKLSNRRLILYLIAQAFGSIVAMLLCVGIFTRNDADYDLTAAFKAVNITPLKNAPITKVFGSEFVLTFILSYVAFAVALDNSESIKKETISMQGTSDSKDLIFYSTTPQSKSGFAPLAIGFVVFSLSLVGGSSGNALNPLRILGPAVFTGQWNGFWIYCLAEILGAVSAAVIVSYTFNFGVNKDLMEYRTFDSPKIRDDFGHNDTYHNIDVDNRSFVSDIQQAFKRENSDARLDNEDDSS